MLIQPIDYSLVAWFLIAALSTAYVAWHQFGRGNPEPTVGRLKLCPTRTRSQNGSDEHRAGVGCLGSIGEDDSPLRKIVQLHSMVEALEHLARHCHGDGRPECPILEDLAS
jgi:hypothetical protein